MRNYNKLLSNSVNKLAKVYIFTYSGILICRETWVSQYLPLLGVVSQLEDGTITLLCLQVWFE